MIMNLIDLFDERLEASLHNTYKVHFFYFLLFFSISMLVLFPFSLKKSGTKINRMLAVSLVLGIVAYLVYTIYTAGGFNV